MRAQRALCNRLKKGANFIVWSTHFELDPAVVQIANRTAYIESLGDLSDAVAKSNALNVAFVKNPRCAHPKSMTANPVSAKL